MSAPLPRMAAIVLLRFASIIGLGTPLESCCPVVVHLDELEGQVRLEPVTTSPRRRCPHADHLSRRSFAPLT